ncbi:hypothetical protein B9T07_00725 [Limnospira fusiformis CCALA 023]|uniref:Sll0314/Alr1548 family TPR repeat-containing protein n=1 Tax=Oscillatoriales TaxID=1150 RepID=UPI00396D77B7
MISLSNLIKSIHPKTITLFGITPIAIALLSLTATAADPFRTNNPRVMGEQTEAAFRAMFERGHYVEAQKYLKQAEQLGTNEPMVFALQASLAYQAQDWDAMKRYADLTLQTAQSLMVSDPLRGNLYMAVGHFLEGAYIVQTQGTIKGAPQALNKLQTVLRLMNAAEQIDPQDPELNLLKGYMDLFLGLNLPFSDPMAAVERLQRYAGPRYLALWGIAIAYRDLDQLDLALTMVNQALEEVPFHPELFYLKAQILASMGRQKNNPQLLDAAYQSFNVALSQPDQLPKLTVAQIFYEQCKTLNNIDSLDRPCHPLRNTIRDTNGLWGPTQLPPL